MQTREEKLAHEIEAMCLEPVLESLQAGITIQKALRKMKYPQ
jgi:hypothetical protein